MNPSAFASIMIIVIFAFIGGMVYIYKRHQVEPEEKTVEKDQLNNLDLTLDQITMKHVKPEDCEQKTSTEKKDDAEEKKKQEEFRIKTAQEKNRMKKTPVDEYLEKIKIAQSDLLKKKF